MLYLMLQSKHFFSQEWDLVLCWKDDILYLLPALWISFTHAWTRSTHTHVSSKTVELNGASGHNKSTFEALQISDWKAHIISQHDENNAILILFELGVSLKN